MARSFIQEGDAIEFTAPSGGVVSGQGYLIGSIFCVAMVTAVAGARANFMTRHVHQLLKNSAEAWTEGQKIYWDNTAKQTTSTATSNTLIGVAAAVAANPSSTGNVRLGIVS